MVVKLKPREEWKILINDLRSFLCRNFNFSADTAFLTPFSSARKVFVPAAATKKSKRTHKKRKGNRSGGVKRDADASQKSSDKENVNWASWEPENVSAESIATNANERIKIRRKRGQRKSKKCDVGSSVEAVEMVEIGDDGDHAGVKLKRKLQTHRENANTVERQESCPTTTTTTDSENPDGNRNSRDGIFVTDSCRSNTSKHEKDLSGNDAPSAEFDDDFATLWEGGKKEDEWSRAAAEAKVAIIQLEDLMLECGHVPGDDDDDDAAAAAAATEEHGVVPPDELTELDDSTSDGNDSSGSQDIQQAVEDARFFSEVAVDVSSMSDDEVEGRRSADVAVELGEAYFPGRRDTLERVAALVPDNFLPVLLNKLATKTLEQFTVDDVLELHEGKRFVQPTAKVVYVTERKNSGVCRGYLRLMKEKKGFALFAPTDHRMPRMMIPLEQCPPDFLKRGDHYANTLFVARLINWENEGLAIGFLCRSLDEGNLIENETEGILIENNIDSSEFSTEILKSLPSDASWAIPAGEVARRRDFRDTCVFTIDPATARDLDDAVSCDALGDDLFHVGVHIADVAYFVREGSALDEAAAHRATSVYLVQRVVPMLPRRLCENLCSLEPGVDRLAFSVEWVMRGSDGAILEEWFGHTVIRSCVKLSYDDAQSVIDSGHPSIADALPVDALASGGSRWTADDVAERILDLHRLASLLRRKRSERGCLRLDQVKVDFVLDEHTGLPVRFHEHRLRDSNRLIEEFMVLANVAVARRIHKAFPDLAVLRRHSSPQDRTLNEVVESCKPYGIFLNPASAEALQESLSRYARDGSELSAARLEVLTLLLAKPMNCAKYFCNGCLKVGDEDTWHYALNIPLYTHFTSPIRRYPDILVHRLLAATLGASRVPPSVTPSIVHGVLNRCNDMKLTAKRVGELSSELFLAVYIKNLGSIIETGMVCRVLDKSFDVLILKLGVVKRVFCEQIPLLRSEFTDSLNVPRLLLVFPAISETAPMSAQQITMFSVVSVVLTASTEGPLKINATLNCPAIARRGVS